MFIDVLKWSKSWVIIPTVKCLSRYSETVGHLVFRCFFIDQIPLGLMRTIHLRVESTKFLELRDLWRYLRHFTPTFDERLCQFLWGKYGFLCFLGHFQCRLLSKLGCSCWVPCWATVAHDHCWYPMASHTIYIPRQSSHHESKHVQTQVVSRGTVWE
jgi:hypothetical protein